MTIVKNIDWKSLIGKSLKIVVAEPNDTVIGIDEETGKAYTLHQPIHLEGSNQDGYSK